MSKIFLIGFMGSGKSFVGQQLAAKLGYGFIDVDTLIENTEGSKIAQIFENHGETHFRKIESEYTRRLEELENTVISTGGGAPCFHDNMTWLNANGTTIYLSAPPELLYKRLKNEGENRPVLRGRTEADLLEFIENKIAERAKFYSAAHITIHQTADGEQVLMDILTALKKEAAFENGLF